MGGRGEGGSRAKPGNQLVYIYDSVLKLVESDRPTALELLPYFDKGFV